MTDDELREFTIRELDCMQKMASEARQQGFRALSGWLKKNAADALKWTARRKA